MASPAARWGLKLDTAINQTAMPPDKIEEMTAVPPSQPGGPSPRAQRLEPLTARQMRSFGLVTLGLLLGFAVPLWDLIRLAGSSEFYSYILLIPFISFYLVWLKRQSWSPNRQSARGLAAGFLTAGLGVLMAYWLGLFLRVKLTEDNAVAVMVTAFLLFFIGICGRFLGRDFLRENTFALCFLAFLVPIPGAAVNEIDYFLQYGSAMATRGFFTLSGTPFLQDGLVFQLPGITLEIAPECSGIHSSLVLFLTSLLASYFFLRNPWKRTAFVLAVIPLGIIRNGFRIFTIGELCVHVGPQMIDSPIHHKGGPIFFALSLIPLFFLLVVLQRSERTRAKSEPKLVKNSNGEFPK